MNDLSPARLCVTYLSTRPSAWRCLFYTLTRRWQSILVMVAPAVILPSLYCLQDWQRGVEPSSRHFVFIPMIYFPVYAVAMWFNVRYRFPTSRPRIFTSSFHDEGFRDVGPGSDRFVAWPRIKTIREHHGDIHVWYGFSGVCYIPANAFSDATAAREFCQSAEALRNERRLRQRHQP